MNGSRVNPNAVPDCFQDYDVVFFTLHAEDERYKKDRTWIRRFGETAIIQQCDFRHGYYIFLIQLKDGTRIDLSFRSIQEIHDAVKEDSLTKVLLDKDKILKPVPEPDETTYLIKKPSRSEWDMCLNELFWLPVCIVKAVHRNEIPLVQYYYANCFLPEMGKLVSWYVGFSADWKVNAGKENRWIKKHLDEKTYTEYIRLFFYSDTDDIIHNLNKARILIRELSLEICKGSEYEYPGQYDKNTEEFINTFSHIYKTE